MQRFNYYEKRFLNFNHNKKGDLVKGVFKMIITFPKNKQQRSCARVDARMVELDFIKDKHKVMFGFYIVKKVYCQSGTNDLELGHFELSNRTVADDLGISKTKAQRLIKEFEELGIIKPISKSNSGHQRSIYCYVVATLGDDAALN